MKNRWINLLFALLVILIASLSFHLFVLAQTREAVGLIINILKPLNILLFSILLFVLSRNLLKLYLGYRAGVAGFRLQTRLILALLPLTLLPTMALFFLSTNFVDDFLQRTIQNPGQTEILRATNSFTSKHFSTVKQLIMPHAAPVLELLRGKREKEVAAYLDRYQLQGVRYLSDGREQAWISRDPELKPAWERIQNRVGREELSGYERLDDGRLLARFAYREGDDTLEFLYLMETGFTERYLFLRDSYVFLKYGQKKTRKLLGLNRSILMVTTLFIIFGGIWVALRFSQRFLVGFKVLIESADRISKGDLDTRVALETGDEMEDVVDAFNKMAGTLKANQEELEQKARDLGLLNARLQSEMRYNQAILQQTRAGILSTDDEHNIRTFNPAFARILGLPGLGRGQNLEAVLAAGAHEPLFRLWRDYRTKGLRSRQLELSDGAGQALHVAAGILPLELDGVHFGDLVVLEDLTELLAAQKLAAWRDVAKRVAHEIKNPLTPIQLSIQRVARKARKDAPDLKDAVYSAHETIMSETDLLKNLVNEFSTFAKMPTPVKHETDLAELVSSVINSYQPVYPQLRIQMQVAEGDWKCLVDGSQMRQVLSNLVNNAAQASDPQASIIVGLARENNEIRLTVDDEGHGILESEREKVFMPYYSRSPKGTGLGLAIVRRIVSDHNGTVAAWPREDKGTRFEVRLPVG